MNFNLGWLQPGLLWLSAFAAAPLIVHLVSRIRPPERRFPTVEFLRRAMSRTFRWRRPQDWLLLVLRTLAIAALALCFPQPVLTGARNLAQTTEGKHLMLVVDRSASMAASGEGQSRFALAVARAVEILRGAGRVESLNLVWLDAQPDAVFPGMGRSRERLEEVLRAATVSGQRGDVPGALKLALERLEKLPGAKELYVLSDLQATAWRENLPAAPKDVQVFKVKLGTDVPNLALSGMEVQPAEPLPGETVQAIARVKNFSPEARLATVVFSLGDTRSTRQVEVQPWSEAQVGLNLPIKEVGEFVVRASLQGSEDHFPPDDQRAIVRRAREGLKIGLAASALPAEELAVWHRALGALPWADLRQGTPRDLGTECEILVAGDPSEETTTATAAVLQRGGTVIYRPLQAPWQPKVPGSGELTASLEKASPDLPWHLRIVNEKSDVFQIFTTGEFGDPASGLFQTRARLASGAEDLRGWDILMAFADGMPALARKKVDRGSIWWWNLSMAPGASTWAGESAFLPFLGEVLLQSRPTSALPAGREVQPGQPASWSPPRLLEGGRIRLRDQAEAEVPVQEDLQSQGGGLRYTTLRPLEPGLYRWLLVQETQGDTGHVVTHTAVNVPEEEMDLRTLAAEAVAFGETLPSSKDAGLSLAELRDGVPLWPWLLAIAAAALLLEGVALACFARSARDTRLKT